MQYIKESTSVPKILSDSFQPFARDLGIQVTLNTLSAFQMGSNVVWRSMPFLGWSARAFSLFKQGLNFKRPELLSYDTQLWLGASRVGACLLGPAPVLGVGVAHGQCLISTSACLLQESTPPPGAPNAPVTNLRFCC